MFYLHGLVKGVDNPRNLFPADSDTVEAKRRHNQQNRPTYKCKKVGYVIDNLTRNVFNHIDKCAKYRIYRYNNFFEADIK